MNFTANEDERFKAMLKSDRKAELVVELSKEIERKEKEMMENISRDYLSIINKCNDLEGVRKRLAGVVNINNELRSSISDGVVQYTSVMKEIEENLLVESRLGLVISELREILEFTAIASSYEDADKDAREGSVYYYDMTKSVLCMEKKLATFRKYTFFVSANQICAKSRRLLIGLMMKDIDLWIESSTNNIRQAGAEVGVIFAEGSKRSHVFDVLGPLRHYFVSRRFLSILHESRRLGISSDVIGRVNERRRVLGDAMSAREDPAVVLDAAGFILWSHYLCSLDKGFWMHDKLLFGILSKSRVMHRASNFSRLREALVSLRRLTVHLNIDHEDVDRIISDVAINYFETQGLEDTDADDCDMEVQRLSMIKLIDDCEGFISNISQFSNELDELLAKKIDQRLCSLVDRNKDDMGLFLRAQTVVSDVLDHASERNSFYRGLEFRCRSSVSRTNEKFMNEVMEQKKAEVDELFKVILESDDFGVDLLKLFSEVRELEFPVDVNTAIRKALALHIKSKFEEAGKNEKMALQQRRVVEGHRCSFYGYLRNNEPSLQGLLSPSTKTHGEP